MVHIFLHVFPSIILSNDFSKTGTWSIFYDFPFRGQGQEMIAYRGTCAPHIINPWLSTVRNLRARWGYWYLCFFFHLLHELIDRSDLLFYLFWSIQVLFMGPMKPLFLDFWWWLLRVSKLGWILCIKRRFILLKMTLLLVCFLAYMS